MMGLGAIAQVQRPISVRSDDQPFTDKAQAYIDSLRLLKDSILVRKVSKVRHEYKFRRDGLRLFMPLTYYDNVAESLFTRDRKENPIHSD